MEIAVDVAYTQSDMKRLQINVSEVEQKVKNVDIKVLDSLNINRMLDTDSRVIVDYKEVLNTHTIKLEITNFYVITIIITNISVEIEHLETVILNVTELEVNSTIVVVRVLNNVHKVLNVCNFA